MGRASKIWKKIYDDHKTYLDFKDSSKNNEDLTAKQGDFCLKWHAGITIKFLQTYQKN